MLIGLPGGRGRLPLTAWREPLGAGRALLPRRWQGPGAWCAGPCWFPPLFSGRSRDMRGWRWKWRTLAAWCWPPTTRTLAPSRPAPNRAARPVGPPVTRAAGTDSHSEGSRGLLGLGFHIAAGFSAREYHHQHLTVVSSFGGLDEWGYCSLYCPLLAVRMHGVSTPKALANSEVNGRIVFLIQLGDNSHMPHFYQIHPLKY